MTIIPTLMGSAGAVILLLSFIQLETNRWRKGTFKYEAGNLVGAVLLVAYAVLIASYPFLILNLIWAAVALRDLIKPKKALRRANVF